MAVEALGKTSTAGIQPKVDGNILCAMVSAEIVGVDDHRYSVNGIFKIRNFCSPGSDAGRCNCPMEAARENCRTAESAVLSESR